MEHETRARFGLYFDDFIVGDIYKHWPGRTVTEGDNEMFCNLTMNIAPLHFDAIYAAQTTRHKQRMVAGLFVLALAAGMGVRDLTGKAIAALGYEDVQHLAPTFIGDTIYSRTKVLEKNLSARGGRGTVKLETLASNQRGEDVLTCKRTIMVPTRPA